MLLAAIIASNMSIRSLRTWFSLLKCQALGSRSAQTYAVAAIRAGDDIKPYLKISAMRLWLLPWIFMVMLPMRWKQSSAERMQAYIDRLQA